MSVHTLYTTAQMSLFKATVPILAHATPVSRPSTASLTTLAVDSLVLIVTAEQDETKLTLCLAPKTVFWPHDVI